MNKYMNQADFATGWRSGMPETPCGRGSRFAETKVQRKWIPEVIAKHGIKSIADIGAGDLNWITRTNLNCKYAAYDLIPRVDSVTKLNLLKDPLPQADCLMVLWVLNHFPPADQRKAMRKLIKADSRYLIITFDHRLESIIDHPYTDKVLLRHDRGVDLEMRVIKLNETTRPKKVSKPKKGSKSSKTR